MLVIQTLHQRVQHGRSRRDDWQVVRQCIAEAEAWQRRYNDVEGLIDLGICRFRKRIDEARQGETGKGEGGYQEKRDGASQW